MLVFFWQLTPGTPVAGAGVKPVIETHPSRPAIRAIAPRPVTHTGSPRPVIRSQRNV